MRWVSWPEKENSGSEPPQRGRRTVPTQFREWSIQTGDLQEANGERREAERV